MFGTYERLNVHVYATSREVIKAAKKKLAPRAFLPERRLARHAFYREMLDYHKDAQDLVREWRL